MRLTDSLALPELDVRHLLPALRPEGVEEVEDDALPVSAGQELVRLLDINKTGSCQVRREVCLVLITKPLPGCQTFCQAELFLPPTQLSRHLFGNSHLLQPSEEPEQNIQRSNISATALTHPG